MKDTIKIDMPVDWLLIMASRGNFGDDRLPEIMKRWAEKQLRENGYANELSRHIKENLDELKARMAKVIGEDKIEEIEAECKMAADYLKIRRNQKLH